MAAVAGVIVLPNGKLPDCKFTLMDPNQRMCCVCHENEFSSVPYDLEKETPFAVCQNLACSEFVCIVCLQKSETIKKPFEVCPFCRHPGKLLTELQPGGSPLRQKQEKIVARHADALVKCETCNAVVRHEEIPAHVEECRFLCPNECGEIITKNTKHFSSCKRVECQKCHSTYLLGQYHNPNTCFTHECLQAQDARTQECLQAQDARTQERFQAQDARTQERFQAQDARFRAQDARITSVFCELNKELRRQEQHLGNVPELCAMLHEQDFEQSMQKATIAEQGKIIRELLQANQELMSKCDHLASEIKHYTRDFDARMRRTEQFVEHNLPGKSRGAAAAVALPYKSGQIITVTHIEAGYVQIGTPVQKCGTARTGRVVTITNAPDNKKMIRVEYVKDGPQHEFVSLKTGEFEKLLFA